MDVAGTKDYEVFKNKDLGAIVIKIPIEADDAKVGICIQKFFSSS